MSPECQHHRVVGMWDDSKVLFTVLILVNEAEPEHVLTPWHAIVALNYQHTNCLNSCSGAMVLGNV